MLGAMVMRLQRQPAALFDHDALDLEPVAEIDRLIGAPGPMHFQMILGDARRHLFEFLHHLRRPSPSSRRATSTASSVVTTTTLSTPNTATNCLSLAT